MPAVTYHDDGRIAKLEADAADATARIARLETEATERNADLASRDARISELDAMAVLRDERIAELVAHVDGILNAQEHRAVIERAKGVIMQTVRCSPDAAFAALVARSQRENKKLRDVAAEVAAWAQG